jgi:hypothetical protein
MKRKQNQKQSVSRDFSEFLALSGSEGLERPRADLMNQVRRDLSPGFVHIAVRLGAIHGIAGSISLLFCPQFGVGPLGGGDGLMGFFMRFGDLACAMGCGSFFMGLTAVAAHLVLNPDEKRALRAQGWLQYLWLVALSWGLLMWLGEGPLATLEYILGWSLAAIGVGVLASRLARASKRVSV